MEEKQDKKTWISWKNHAGLERYEGEKLFFINIHYFFNLSKRSKFMKPTDSFSNKTTWNIFQMKYIYFIGIIFHFQIKDATFFMQ